MRLSIMLGVAVGAIALPSAASAMAMINKSDIMLANLPAPVWKTPAPSVAPPLGGSLPSPAAAVGLPVPEFANPVAPVVTGPEGFQPPANLPGIAQPVVSGVPEPLTWAMMIAGFGLVGAAVRQRRVMTTVTA
jgi:hypothetical protein